jgi:poly-D-alanine transfer protein DltD
MRKCLVVLVTFHLSFLTAFAQTSTVSQSNVETIKATVKKLGTNRRLRSVVLKDGTKLKGFILEIKDESFVLVDSYEVSAGRVFAKAKKKAPREISYDEVDKLKPYKTKGASIASGAVVAGVVVGIVVGIGFLIGIVAGKD